MTSKVVRVLWVILLFVGVIAELGFQTFLLGYYDNYINPIVWLTGGLITVIAAMQLLAFSTEPEEVQSNYKNSNNFLLFLTAGISIPLIASMLYPIFQAHPSDPLASDILPSLELYVRRFLSGETVYAPMQFPDWVVLPTYFPLLWMPYCFSEILNIDYRWTAYLVFIIAVFIYLLRLKNQDLFPLEALFKAALPFLFIFIYIATTPKILGLAVELLPVGFYLILCATILSRRYWLMSLGILLCLLSRYAFTFWLPIYLLVIWIEQGFMKVLKVSVLVLAGVIALYVLPFMANDWQILSRGLQYYAETAVGQWVPQYWQLPNEIPFHLNQGMSFALYFYDFADGNVTERLLLNRKVHLFAAGAAAILILAGYFYFRKKGLNVKWYLIIALKFYLLIFYGFFYVPFSYLFMLPMFLSLPLLWGVEWKQVLKPG